MTTPLNPNAPSRVDYLAKTVPAQFTAVASSPFGGQAIATIGPDQGQYWFPTFIVVASSVGKDPTDSGIRPSCTVYAGARGIYDVTTYVDDTASGNQDTSSIISGVMLQPGEVVTAIWDGNENSGTAVLKVYGYVSNIPLAASGYLPESPGTHFSGHLTTIATAAIPFSALGNPPSSLASGATFTTPFIDLSAFQSYILTLQAFTLTGLTNFNPVSVTLKWVIAPFNQTVRDEFYEFFSNQSGVVTGDCSDNGQLIVSDQCHGNWLQITLHNDGPDTVHIGMGVAGNSRQMGSPYVREDDVLGAATSRSADNLLLDQVRVNVAAGVAEKWGTRIGCGRVLFRMTANTQIFNFDIIIPGASVITERFVVAANTTALQEYILPNRGAQFTITNTGAANGPYAIQVFRQMPPW